jgi:hypothetical protein
MSNFLLYKIDYLIFTGLNASLQRKFTQKILLCLILVAIESSALGSFMAKVQSSIDIDNF